MSEIEGLLRETIYGMPTLTYQGYFNVDYMTGEANQQPGITAYLPGSSRNQGLTWSSEVLAPTYRLSGTQTPWKAVALVALVSARLGAGGMGAASSECPLSNTGEVSNRPGHRLIRGPL